MSVSSLATVFRDVPMAGILALAVVFAVGLFLVAFDQGHLLSLAYGQLAFDENMLHEFTHDLRHSAGFPCH